MDSKSITRKDFFLLTFTLIGSGAAAACSSSSNNPVDGGKGGAGGAGGAGGGGGAGGAGGSGGADAGGTEVGGDAATATCADPLPEAQVADSLGHVHTLTIGAATLNATTAQTFTTSSAGTSPHAHMVTLTVANLGTLKGGGSLSVMSAIADGHLHTYLVSCTGLTDAGGQ